MEYNLTEQVDRSPADVFAFFATLHRLPRDPTSLVPVYEKAPDGPLAPGDRIREVIRLSPLHTGTIWSTVTAVLPGELISYRWEGMWMFGELTYTFEPWDGGTLLTQRHTLNLYRTIRPFGPLLGRVFERQIRDRLDHICLLLESDAALAAPQP